MSVPSPSFAQFGQLLRSIVTALKEYVPVCDDGQVRTAEVQLATISTRIYDQYLTVPEAKAASRREFGEDGVLPMLAAVIREHGEGRQYTQTHYLSGLIAPYSATMQKFIVECPPDSFEWRTLRSLLRDGLVLYSTSVQATWAMLPAFRELAAIWVRKNELAKNALPSPIEDGENTGDAPPPTYRPRDKQDDEDEPSRDSIGYGPP